METEEEIKKIILKQHIDELPSLSFTDDVMEQVYAIEAQKRSDYKPLFPKYIWAVSIMLIVVFLANSSTSLDSNDTLLNTIKIDLSISPIVSLATVCISFLLLLDYYLGAKLNIVRFK